MSDEILKNLNKEQREAVEHKDGPLLIVAGAGTGKTTVITKRIAHIIKEEWAAPEEILALTFTEKAATEMEDRVIDSLTYGYFDLWISTFHSFAERILREEGLAIGLPTDFKLLNEFDQYILFKRNFDRFELDYYRPMGNPTKFIKTLLSHFSRAKDEDISPEQYLAYAEELEQNLDGMLNGSKSKKGRANNITNFQDAEGNFNEEIAASEVARIKEIANAYHTYEQILLENSSLDFGDLINYCLKLFRDRPEILEKYRKKFKYILLDEFQDTNWAQYELIKLISAPHNNLVMVGDDDQCLPGDSLIRTKDGTKRIDKIKKGEEVASAAGRGYLSHYKVSKVKKEKKRAKFLTFTTREGSKVKVTDNHKMFCFVPNSLYHYSDYNDDYDVYYYVYLMHKNGLGWRIGITNDPAVRLRMERSADKMVVMQAFASEHEARFYENLYSLKYGIPTVCFAERDGVMTKRKWSERLYKELDVEKGVKQFAHDLGIDLDYHQIGLDAVNRGGKIRIKIVIENCMRKYRSKYAKGVYLESPALNHGLVLETSHKDTLEKLEKLGYSLTKSRKGKRLRIVSKDLDYLGGVACEIQKHVGGIIENRIKVAKNNVAHKKALVVPAGNVLEGMFLPVVKEDDIYYEQVKKIDSEIKTRNVYDLEVEYAHNFVANDVVVHNSIFRFRGASMSNILQFKKDYPEAKQIFLVNNYRTGQNILDLSYDFVAQNNPNRLEHQLEKKEKLSKKLISQTGKKGKVELLSGHSMEEEMKEIVEKVIKLKEKDEEVTWDDFAILVRTNQGADDVCQYLEEAELPYMLYSSKGLYNKDLIMDIICYLKLVIGYHNDTCFFRVLNLAIFGFHTKELADFNYWSRRKSWSLYEVLNNAATLGFGQDTQKRIQKVLPLIKKHAGEARSKNTSEVYINFLNDSGLLKHLIKQSDYNKESAVLLQQFMKRIKKFESESADKRVAAFLDELQMEMDAGETGDIPMDLDAGPEAIKVMTVHAAKGLEFKYVFIAHLVDKRFPTTERKEPLPLPDALIKESLPEGDIHLEEERRLFYVALTRGKERVFLSWAPNYGGKIMKKPSQFLVETGFVEDPTEQIEKAKEQKAKDSLEDLEKKEGQKAPQQTDEHLPVPTTFSYTQITAFINCPYQYKFAHILKVPSKGKAVFSFGKTLHNVLQKTFEIVNSRRGMNQGDLFGDSEERSEEDGLITLDEIMDLYKKNWIDDWYESKKSKEETYEKGKKILKDFYNKYKDNWPNATLLEKGFNFKINIGGEYCTVKGAMDRVDENGDKIKIVDYKTGQMPQNGKLEFDKKLQLLIYQMAARDIFRKEVESLSFYYLENNEEVEVLGSDKDLEKAREKITNTIQGIKKGEFPAKPGPLCKFCDFRDICEYRKI